MEPDTRGWKGLVWADAVGAVWIEGRSRVVLPCAALALVPITRTAAGFRRAVIARIALGDRQPDDI